MKKTGIGKCLFRFFALTLKSGGLFGEVEDCGDLLHLLI